MPRSMLRQMVATLAYRAAKAVREAPPHFEHLTVAPGSRTPVQILAHMGDLFDWALSMARGRTVWRDSTPLPWSEEAERFFAALTKFDEFLAGEEPLDPAVMDKLIQGPIADALTHTGQLTYLRRLGGIPVRGENYARAEIIAGRTGLAQAVSRVEFD